MKLIKSYECKLQRVRHGASTFLVQRVKFVLFKFFISADKCLLPYYGGCDYTRECETSRLQVTCGDCLPNLGRVEVSGAVARCQGTICDFDN